MVMVADFVPGLKRVFGHVRTRLVFRVVIAFILHSGRMSCLAAAAEQAERRCAERPKTPGGIVKRQRPVRNSIAPEYRAVV